MESTRTPRRTPEGQPPRLTSSEPPLTLDKLDADALREIYKHVDVPLALKLTCRALRDAGPEKTKCYEKEAFDRTPQWLRWAYETGMRLNANDAKMKKLLTPAAMEARVNARQLEWDLRKAEKEFDRRARGFGVKSLAEWRTKWDQRGRPLVEGLPYIFDFQRESWFRANDAVPYCRREANDARQEAIELHVQSCFGPYSSLAAYRASLRVARVEC